MKTTNDLLQSVLIGVVLAFVLGAAIFVILGSPGSVPESGVRLAPPQGGEPVYIVVESGDTAASIGTRLESAGIIDSAATFERLASITGAETRLAAGEYEFVAGTSSLDALVRIRDGLTASRIVTIPEGLRIEEIATLLERRGVVSAADFLAAATRLAQSHEGLDTDLLAGKPAEASLEGYIFPATYSFSARVTPEEVVQTMVGTLADRLTPELRAEARAQDWTVYEVLSLAAIVEREAVVPNERSVIASVYRNRIEIDMALQADPTVQYAVSQRPGSIAQFGYWKNALTLDDLEYQSAYNTYVVNGMPPGPIANPGLESIIAVIRPASTEYLFFVARNDGSHAFAETFAEHERNVDRYQR